MELGLTLDPAKITGRTPDEARHTLLNAYDQKYRAEMHSVERSLVLEQLDSSWKSHLLVMDSLRSGVGLGGYAQEDPKIVYKREGMKEFEVMWEGVRDRITEAVFRIEEMGDEEAQARSGRRAGHTRGRDLGSASSPGTGGRVLDADQCRRRGQEARADPECWPEGWPQRPLPLR